MCSGFGMVSLAGLLGPRVLADNSATVPHFAPRAKRVIFLFMNGGPSHMDTFDPKPKLREMEGKQPDGELFKKTKGTGFMPSPLRFDKCGQSGIEVSESLPNIGRIIDDCCVIRSMKTDVPNHEPALLQMHTGNIQPIRPSMGSWLLYGLGTENQNLPGYVVLRPSPNIVVGPALWSNSFLPAEFQATSIITKDMQVEKLIANIKNPKLNSDQQRQQLDLVQALNHRHAAARAHDPELEGQIKTMETAFQMQKRAMQTFDISREPQHIREMYGDTTFARSCLLARRLVEDGVRFVSVYYTSSNNQPWDTHSDHNSGHKKLCLDSDKATAALITDLKQRGLLDDTLVIWGGEFGRTPYSQLDDKEKDTKKAGRDHHHTAFSMLLAGGGVKGGTVYGASDELGMHATENPV
ncbi:MAG: Sulfatase, partial [Verrucomicrobiales bacterium]|nr:Sulfatase [Verrucomicrobiales bacterium]